jgi:cytochrome c oxidase cbb3-type subunit 4
VSFHSTYDTLRHLADSWGLLAMLLVFVAFASWPFRPGAQGRNDSAARMIFESDDHER